MYIYRISHALDSLGKLILSPSIVGGIAMRK